jgi:hypothetical protein
VPAANVDDFQFQTRLEIEIGRAWLLELKDQNEEHGRRYNVLYCTAVCFDLLHCTALYCTVLYRTELHCTALYCTAPYCTVLYCTVLHCTVLHRTALHYCIVMHACTVLQHLTTSGLISSDTNIGLLIYAIRHLHSVHRTKEKSENVPQRNTTDFSI